MEQMTFQEMKIKDLAHAEYNPRTQMKKGDAEYTSIERSLDEFGLVDPIVWNKQTGNVVGGHKRLQVLKDKGFEKVTVSVVDVPLEREKALNLALNRIGEGNWDHDKLAEILGEFDDELAELTGFTDEELERYERMFEANHATDFLGDDGNDGEQGGADYEPTPQSHPDPGEETGEATQYFPMTFTFSEDQRQTVLDAIKIAKDKWGLPTSMDALHEICARFKANKGE